MQILDGNAAEPIRISSSARGPELRCCWSGDRRNHRGSPGANSLFTLGFFDDPRCSRAYLAVVAIPIKLLERLQQLESAQPLAALRRVYCIRVWRPHLPLDSSDRQQVPTSVELLSWPGAASMSAGHEPSRVSRKRHLARSVGVYQA